MRQDICHYYEAALPAVYNAYAQVAKEKFGCKCDYHNQYKLSFGLKFSLKYNMNGGVCTIHLMPCQTGTAVNVRFTLVQLAGARYKAYDEDLTKNVASLLGAYTSILSSDPDQFERFIEDQRLNGKL